MKKMIMVLMMVFTMMAGLFAEEKTWNINYRIRMVTPDEFYATVTVNPCWQEYDEWIDEDDDSIVDYMDPYWDNDVVNTAIAQEEESIKEEHTDGRTYAYIEISYGDSFDDKLNTLRIFIRDLKTYEMWEFSFLEAALSEKKRSEKE